MGKISNPYFICIGPVKTGTTWLHRSLNRLPEVEMPRAKELRFYWNNGDPRRLFNDLPAGPFEKYLGVVSYAWRKKYLRKTVHQYLSGKDKIKLRSIVWDLKYLFMPQSVFWYKSLFPKNKISGDIDGKYILYNQNTISLLKQHLPDVKIILILRDPIEKYWSDLRMWAYQMRGLDLNYKSEKQIVRRFRKILIDRPRYSDVIELWRDNFPDNQFYIAYFDDLQKDPREHFNGICAFLGIELPDTEIVGLNEVTFKGTPFAMPAAVERAAHEILIPDLKRLVTMVDSDYPKIWLRTMLERKALLKADED